MQRTNRHKSIVLELTGWSDTDFDYANTYIRVFYSEITEATNETLLKELVLKP